MAWGPSSFTSGVGSVNSAVAIAASESLGVALKSDGSLAQWGLFPFQGPFTTNTVCIAAGVLGGAGSRADGSVFAWGNNFAGQTNVPSGLSNVTAVASSFATLAKFAQELDVRTLPGEST